MATLIQSPTDEMEVIETTYSDDPESAQRAGEQIARKYRYQGHACECIGVVAMTKASPFQEETSERLRADFGMVRRATQTVYIDQAVYHPAIFPKPPTGEEE